MLNFREKRENFLIKYVFLLSTGQTKKGGVDMEKNHLIKIKLFKKEGFYVVLFLCLCIVAAIAAISVKSNSHVKKEPIENKVVENKKKKIRQRL